MMRLSKFHLFTLVTVSCVNFFCAICVSLQAPFYPAEAEKKGATATEYGLVIGCYELIHFLFSPIFGKIIHKTGSKMMLGVGMIVCSISLIFFGLLDWLDDRFSFIFFSFILRITEGLGAAAAVIGSFSIMGCMFPTNIATVMSTMEMFYGLGFIVGPTLGGVLYQLGGFSLPFVFIGVISSMVSILIMIFIPDVTESISEHDNGDGNFKRLLKNPSILINTASTVIFAASQGFYTATLEPHLRVFRISPLLVSFMFVINGLTYAGSSPFFGKLVNSYANPKNVNMIACLLNIVSSSVIGPLPYLPIPNTLTVCIIGLVFQGFALAAGNVSSFIDLVRSAADVGLSPGISTYGMVTGIWASAFAFGAFIGPSISGFLYDRIGFQLATLFVIVINTILLAVMIIYCIVSKLRRKDKLVFLIGDPAENNTLESIYNKSEYTTDLIRNTSSSSDSESSFHNNYGTL